MTTQIVQVLDNYLKTYADAQNPKIPIAYYNMQYQPNKQQTFFKPCLTPIAPRIYSAFANEDKDTGVYVVEVFAPENKGAVDLWKQVDGLKAHFARDKFTSLTIDTVAYTISFLRCYDETNAAADAKVWPYPGWVAWDVIIEYLVR